MLSIPELATQIVDKNLSEMSDDNSRTIFIVGSKAVGKSTLLYSFLDKPDTPRETLVLEYSFGRKSNQKQGIEKNICHVWEYGGKLDLLKNVLPSVPVRGQFYYCIMIDLSKVKTVWTTIETCINAMKETYGTSGNMPETVIICGKYDLFKNYDSEIKKVICTTLRSVAICINAHLIFYSSKEALLSRRAKEMFVSLGFGSGVPFKDKNTNFTKPLLIPKGADTWENIGISPASFEQIKAEHISRIAPEPIHSSDAISSGPQRTHPEPALDALAALKYDEITSMQSLDITIEDYLKNIR